MVAGVVFDMDDTLYLERDFSRSAFHAVARHLEEAGAADADEVFNFLWSDFESGGGKGSYNRLLSHMGLEADPETIAELVAVHRTHRPKIQLLHGILELVDELTARGIKVGLITDGPEEAQSGKVKALGIAKFAEPIVITGDFSLGKNKPHHGSFERFPKAWNVSPTSLVYVGDNCKKDFIAPNQLGWRSIRVRMDGQLHCALEPDTDLHAPTVEVDGIPALRRLLASW